MYLRNLIALSRTVEGVVIQFNGPSYEQGTGVHRYHFTMYAKKSGRQLCTAVVGALHSETIADLLYACRNGMGLASNAIAWEGPKQPNTQQATIAAVDAMLWVISDFQDLKDQWVRDIQKLEARASERRTTAKALEAAIHAHRAAKAAYAVAKKRVS